MTTSTVLLKRRYTCPLCMAVMAPRPTLGVLECSNQRCRALLLFSSKAKTAYCTDSWPALEPEDAEHLKP